MQAPLGRSERDVHGGDPRRILLALLAAALPALSLWLRGSPTRPSRTRTSPSSRRPWSRGTRSPCLSDVTNTGSVAGAEVVQLYLGFPTETSEPPRSSKASRRCPRPPELTQHVTFSVDPSSYRSGARAEPGGAYPGTYSVRVGSSSQDGGVFEVLRRDMRPPKGSSRRCARHDGVDRDGDAHGGVMRRPLRPRCSDGHGA